MATKTNPFLTAAAQSLGKAAAPAATPSVGDLSEKPSAPSSRFLLLTRKGGTWSYPYSYVGLIELPNPETLVIYCNSREVERIEITGRCLDEVAELLHAQRLGSLAEADNVNFAAAGVFVRQIAVKLSEKTTPRG